MSIPTEQQRKSEKREAAKFWLAYYLEMFGAYSLAALIILWNWW